MASSPQYNLEVHPHHEPYEELNIMQPTLLQPEFLPFFSWFLHLYPDIQVQLYCEQFWGRGCYFVFCLSSMWKTRILDYHPDEDFQGLTKIAKG